MMTRQVHLFTHLLITSCVLWVSYLTVLCLRFITWKMGIIEPASQACSEDSMTSHMKSG